MRHIRNIGRLFLATFLFIIGIPKDVGIWWKDLLFIKDTIGFSLATGLFSFLVGLFLATELFFKYRFTVLDGNSPAFFWSIVACIAGFVQLYSVSSGNIKLRQVAAITQLLMYLFFLTLIILTGTIGLLVPIILTQLILLFVSTVKLTQETTSNVRR